MTPLICLLTMFSAFSVAAHGFSGTWVGTFTTRGLGSMRAEIDLTRVGDPGPDQITGDWQGSFDKIGPSGRITKARCYLFETGWEAGHWNGRRKRKRTDRDSTRAGQRSLFVFFRNLMNHSSSSLLSRATT